MKYNLQIKHLCVFTHILLLSLSTSSCDSNEKQENIEIDDIDSHRGIVVNEGQFGYGTSSITLFSKQGNVQQDVFRKVNNRPMGDVAQSMTRIGDNLYVPLNNSKKLEVFNHETFESVETISINEDVIQIGRAHV